MKNVHVQCQVLCKRLKSTGASVAYIDIRDGKVSNNHRKFKGLRIYIFLILFLV